MMGGHPQNRQGGGRPPHRTQSFDSSGPSVKIRGNAYQVFERYIAMAREAASAGDRIAAENLYQHAEHYYRIMQVNGGYDNQGQRPMTPADNDMSGGDDMDGRGSQPGAHGQPQPQPQSQMQQSPQQPRPPQQHQPQQHPQPQPQSQPQPQPQVSAPQPSATPRPAEAGMQPPPPPVEPDYNA
ncbi:MAG: DUF4167 domain-containing protein [Alphaproteobacteria bacterium]|nr:DUF4167 domain-containing protein [Alphaproteobacteria bacterium]